MTGWIDNGSFILPISKVSIGFLDDLGYSVNYDSADNYDITEQNIGEQDPTTNQQNIAINTLGSINHNSINWSLYTTDTKQSMI